MFSSNLNYTEMQKNCFKTMAEHTSETKVEYATLIADAAYVLCTQPEWRKGFHPLTVWNIAINHVKKNLKTQAAVALLNDPEFLKNDPAVKYSCIKQFHDILKGKKIHKIPKIEPFSSDPQEISTVLISTFRPTNKKRRKSKIEDKDKGQSSSQVIKVFLNSHQKVLTAPVPKVM